MSMKLLICTINFFMVPFISVDIELRRGKKDRKFNFDTFLIYSSYLVLIIPVSYIAGVVLNKIGVISYAINAKTVLYTLISVISAFLLPYIKEVFSVYLNIKCEIKPIDRNDN